MLFRSILFLFYSHYGCTFTMAGGGVHACQRTIQIKTTTTAGKVRKAKANVLRNAYATRHALRSEFVFALRNSRLNEKLTRYALRPNLWSRRTKNETRYALRFALCTRGISHFSIMRLASTFASRYVCFCVYSRKTRHKRERRKCTQKL